MKCGPRAGLRMTVTVTVKRTAHDVDISLDESTDPGVIYADGQRYRVSDWNLPFSPIQSGKFAKGVLSPLRNLARKLRWTSNES